MCKLTCFEELTVFHLLSSMGKKGCEKGYKNGLGAMSAEERMAASEKGYENGLGAMSTEARMVARKRDPPWKRIAQRSVTRGRRSMLSSNHTTGCQRKEPGYIIGNVNSWAIHCPKRLASFGYSTLASEEKAVTITEAKRC